MAKKRTLFSYILLALTNTLIAQTTIEKKDGSWQLYVENETYEIKGATFGYDNDVENYEDHFKRLNFLGVNTIRTWATGKNTPKLLDAAHKHGIKVMLGIWMRHGRPGMEDDDSFNYLSDKAGKETMYENALRVVKTFKDHPAVLMWGIGNEVYLNTATDEEKLAYSKLLERISKEVKNLDPNHLVSSVEAWTFGLDWWQKHVPSIDVYGLNSYGIGVHFLADELSKRNIDKPYIITEFGVTGEWDIKEKVSGVIQEPTDTQKYNAIANGIQEWIQNKPANLGVFVFHFASGVNFVAPWLFTSYDSMTRPQYWAIRKAFTDNDPLNYVPEIHEFKTLSSESESNLWIPLNLEVSDKENDTLTVRFAYNHRVGSRKYRDNINPLEYRGNSVDGFEIKTPEVDGAVKIYAMVTDTYNNIGIATTGIKINSEIGKKRKYLVPKKTLPFYVYKDGTENPYVATAYMGNYKDMVVDTQFSEDAYSGNSSLKISYNHDFDWYGLALVDPANDWGEILGGYDISGAKKFTFWAKASKKNVMATIGFGLIGKDKPYPDTAKKSIEIKLSTKWKKYSINLKKLDLSCIRSGLTIFSSSYRSRQDIFIDDVRFE